MRSRNTKRRGRASVRGRSLSQVLDRGDEAGIAEFFHAQGLALMRLAQRLSECKLKLNDLLAEAGQALVE